MERLELTQNNLDRCAYLHSPLLSCDFVMTELSSAKEDLPEDSLVSSEKEAAIPAGTYLLAPTFRPGASVVLFSRPRPNCSSG